MEEKAMGVRRKVDDYKQLRIQELKHLGYLKEGNHFKKILYRSCDEESAGTVEIELDLRAKHNYVRVYFTLDDDNPQKSVNCDYKIQIEKTPCRYGGYRYRFLCPCSGKRSSTLYLQDNWWFACRKELNLCYKEQNESKKRRSLAQWLRRLRKAEFLFDAIRRTHKNKHYTRKYRQYLSLIKDNNADKDMEDLMYNGFVRKPTQLDVQAMSDLDYQERMESNLIM